LHKNRVVVKKCEYILTSLDPAGEYDVLALAERAQGCVELSTLGVEYDRFFRRH